MRKIALFLIVNSIAFASFAQPAAGPNAAAGTSATGTASGAPKLNAQGQLEIGYEGRGDYRKARKQANKAAAEKSEGVTSATKGSDAPSNSMPTTIMADVPATNESGDTPKESKKDKRKTRSDSSLRGDGSNAREAEEAARKEREKAREAENKKKGSGNNEKTKGEQAQDAANKNTGGVAQGNNNGTMVIIGGKVVRQ